MTLAAHIEGDAAFDRTFVTAPAQLFGGLGPVFNESSCVACHVANGRAPESILHRIGLPGTDGEGGPAALSGYGHQVQDRAVFGKPPEARPSITWLETIETLGDGTIIPLRSPMVSFDSPWAPIPPSVLVSTRMGPPVFGLGLLEAISESDLLGLASVQNAGDDGISGRPNSVWDVEQQRRVIGRFGWKANEPTVHQQVAHAYNEDMGITNPLFPTESCAEQAQHDDLADDPEIDEDVVRMTTIYVQTLGVPARRNLDDPMANDGRRLFETIGCTSCHVPRLVTGAHDLAELSNQTIFPFTDLLLHEMGPGLADSRPDFEASGSEWRTPPLWGIGLLKTVNGKLELLHDGRARDFVEAILWHGGEAAPARERFRALTRNERDAIVTFLESL